MVRKQVNVNITLFERSGWFFSVIDGAAGKKLLRSVRSCPHEPDNLQIRGIKNFGDVKARWRRSKKWQENHTSKQCNSLHGEHHTLYCFYNFNGISKKSLLQLSFKVRSRVYNSLTSDSLPRIPALRILIEDFRYEPIFWNSTCWQDLLQSWKHGPEKIMSFSWRGRPRKH